MVKVIRGGQKQSTTVIKKGDIVIGKSTPSEDTSSGRQIQDIVYGGGGSEGSSQAQFQAKREAELKRQAQLDTQIKAEAEAKARAEGFARTKAAADKAYQERLILIEKDRIRRANEKLIRENAQRRVINSVNQQGQKIRQETLINNRTNERVVVRTNLDTGEVKTRTFEKRVDEKTGRKVGGGVVESGGIVEQKGKTQTPKEQFEAIVKENLMTGQSVMPPQSEILKRNIKNIKNPSQAFDVVKQVSKLIVVDSPKQIGNVFKDYGLSLGKGIVKVPLYAIDNSGYASQIRFNPSTKKFYIPQGTTAISDKFGKVKKWVDYDYKTNPFKDPDYQNVGITTAFTLVGVISPGTAAKLFGAVKGKAVWDAVKDPTPYNVAVAESLFIPGAIKKLKKLRARGDILVAKRGELVPLKERIKQVDVLIDNAGKKIESITAKPTKKAGFTNIKNVKSIDYTYGKKIEFATSKVGKAYPTSEYFLKGKGTKLQKLLKSGRVNIEETIVGKTNRKYGSYIKNTLLKNGRVPESFIKKYYAELKAEANRLNKPVAGISPKRLRGYAQPEQELVKILPDNYKPKKLKFAGYTEEGYKVYTDKSYGANIKSFLKSKLQKGKIERSYFKEIAGEKLEYLKGRPAIKGEYAEHGKGHLTAENVDPYAKKYARKQNVKNYGNVFEKHDLAKVSDADSFAQFEHGEILYKLWKKGDFPDKSIYKLPKKLQKQIADAYAGHTPVKPKFIDTLKKGWKDNSVTKDLIWYVKNKRNPYLADTLTLDRIELPRAGRWDFKVKYNYLDKNALKRIYGSELNAIKNIRFLDWESVPSRLKRQLGNRRILEIKVRDASILRRLKSAFNKRNLKSSINKKYLPKTTKYSPSNLRRRLIPNYKTSSYKAYSTPKYRLAYKQGYLRGYKSSYKNPTNYKTKYGKYSNAYEKGYKDGYTIKTNYKITPPYTPTPYKPGKYTPGKPPITPPKKPPVRPFIPKGFKRKKLSTKQDAYYVAMKVKGKLVNLNAKPLILKDAKDYLAYRLDTGLSRTAFFIPLGRTNTAVGLPQNMRGYFNKISNKLRPYKIRAGKKRAILRGYIEKKKYVGDTASEIRQLQDSRKGRSRVKRPVRRVIKRRTTITPQRRKQLILQLKKARAVRMNNLGKSSIQKRRIITRPVSKRRIITKKKTISPQRRRQLILQLKKARAVRMRNLGKSSGIKRVRKSVYQITPRKTIKKTVKRIMSPARKKEMLKNLAKARAVRMRNLRRKK